MGWDDLYHLREHCGARLTDEDMRGIDMAGDDYRRSDLSRTNMTGASLRWADLRGANCDTQTLAELQRH